MITAAVRPRGPYSLRDTTRAGSDATRAVVDGVLIAALASGGVGRAWQQADGIVQLRLMGACGSCPVSTLTLKQGIERRMMMAVPEVKGIYAL